MGILGDLFDWVFGDDDGDLDDIVEINDDGEFDDELNIQEADDGEFDDELNIREAEDGTLFIDTTSGNDTIIIKPDGDFYSGKN